VIMAATPIVEGAGPRGEERRRALQWGAVSSADGQRVAGEARGVGGARGEGGGQATPGAHAHGHVQPVAQ
jgi:hypothetical protein